MSAQDSSNERLDFMKREHEKTLAALHTEVRLLQEKNSNMSFKLLIAQQATDDLAIANDRIRELECEREHLLKHHKEMEVMIDLTQSENNELRVEKDSACAMVRMSNT